MMPRTVWPASLGAVAHGQEGDFRMDICVLDRWMGEPTHRDRPEHDALASPNHHELTDLRPVDPRPSGLVRAALDRST